MGEPVVGVVGHRNAGKTTLVEGLVRELRGRGLVVRTIKHTHHAIDLDEEGKDSWRHRAAGAASVALVSPGRWVIQHELEGGADPTIEEVARALGPADVVLVEGWKAATHPKIEVRGPEAPTRLADRDPAVFAVACPTPDPHAGVPEFHRDEVGALADALLRRLGG